MHCKLVSLSLRVTLNFTIKNRSYHVVAPKNDKNYIDFRSDTVTQPTEEMRLAMMSAKVGDDVYKEDPTINQLEQKCAELFGMERALFVPTGCMGNLLCLMAHINGRSEELIIGSEQHVYIYEQGHFMQLASIPAKVLPNEPDGTISLDAIRENITDASDFHFSETKLICLENSHLRSGGSPLPLEYMKQVSDLAKIRGMKVHVDGARIYNSAVSLNLPLKDLLVHADSVSMCLSKGLGCPVGSVIGGTDQLIDRTIRLRKLLGGGIRQGGILAAAGLIALKNARENLSRDHVNARKLANGIHALNSKNIHVDPNKVRTNIIFLKTKKSMSNKIYERLKKHGILSSVFSDSSVRLVTHLNVNENDVIKCVESIKTIDNDL